MELEKTPDKIHAIAPAERLLKVSYGNQPIHLFSNKSCHTNRIEQSSPPSSQYWEPGSIGLFAKRITATLYQLNFPGGYLVRSNFKLFCNLRNRLVAPQSDNGHLSLERCRVCTTWSTCHNCSPFHRYTTDYPDRPTHL
jgi:hypothetical protein